MLKNKKYYAVFASIAALLIGISSYAYMQSQNTKANGELQTQNEEAENQIQTYAAGTEEKLMHIKETVQWTDAENGSAKINVSYSAEDSTSTTVKDMNLIILHDKSGSMDSNYGFNLEKNRQGWDKAEDVAFFPIKNSGSGLSIRIQDVLKDIENIAGYSADKYLEDITRPVSGTSTANIVGFNGTYINRDMYNNSPCQVDGHYYLAIKDSTSATYNGSCSAWTMVSGKQIYHIANTDLHHYVMLKDRNEALEYLRQDRRVIRMDAGSIMNENGDKYSPNDDNPRYFLDVSQLQKHNGKWILCTCPEGTECVEENRLNSSQRLLNEVVEKVSEKTDNKIAYIPFWGNVPDENGDWTNESGICINGLYTTEIIQGGITHQDGVKKLELTNDIEAIKTQINNDFTYNGTNWSYAFYHAQLELKKDQNKDALILFITDGVPGGYEGRTDDLINTAIAGYTVDQYDRIEYGHLYNLYKNYENATIWCEKA